MPWDSSVPSARVSLDPCYSQTHCWVIEQCADTMFWVTVHCAGWWSSVLCDGMLWRVMLWRSGWMGNVPGGAMMFWVICQCARWCKDVLSDDMSCRVRLQCASWHNALVDATMCWMDDWAMLWCAGWRYVVLHNETMCWCFCEGWHCNILGDWEMCQLSLWFAKWSGNVLGGGMFCWMILQCAGWSGNMPGDTTTCWVIR